MMSQSGWNWRDLWLWARLGCFMVYCSGRPTAGSDTNAVCLSPWAPLLSSTAFLHLLWLHYMLASLRDSLCVCVCVCVCVYKPWAHLTSELWSVGQTCATLSLVKGEVCISCASCNTAFIFVENICETQLWCCCD